MEESADVPVEVLYTNSQEGDPDYQDQEPFYDDQQDAGGSERSSQQNSERYSQPEDYDEDTFLKLAKSVLEAEGVDYEDWKTTAMNAANENDYDRAMSNSSGYYTESEHSSYFYSDSDETHTSGYYDSSEGQDEEEEEEEEEDLEEPQSSSEEEKPKTPLMGMKSFRHLETKVLVKYMLKTDDERMHELRRKLKKLKKVEAPNVYGVRKSTGRDTLKEELEDAKTASGPGGSIAEKEAEAMRWFGEGDEEDFEGDEEEGEDEGSYHSSQKATFKFTKEEWALKNTLSFLRKSGCPDQTESEPRIDLNDSELEVKLKVFLGEKGMGKKHRDGLGNADAAPEITAAMKRQAERSFLRALVRNSRPKFPLARFILPEFRNLKKIEASLIGPGSYEVESVYENQRLKRLRSIPSRFASCSSRFPKDKARPPACDTFSDSWAVWEAAVERSRHPGKVPLFQSTPCNFRENALARGWGVAPNHYNIKSPLQELLDKRVSTKPLFENGHYDTCKSSLPDISRNLGPGSYEVRKSLIKRLTDPYNCFKGKISKTPRNKMFGFKAAFLKPLWPVENNMPDPGTYSPYAFDEWVEASWAPFGIQDKARKPSRKDDGKLACPDYYFYANDVKGIKEERQGITGDGWKSDFISKTPINTPEERYAALKERNKALNHKWDQEDILRREKVVGDPRCDRIH